MKNNELKMVVFDLDETLGCFTQFGMLWDTISILLNKSFNQDIFNKICKLYPKLFRPYIFTILRYLKKKTQQNNQTKIIIYTNNQGPKTWTHFIKNYIEDKINYKLFDKAICAYKFNNKQIELCRTSHNKIYDDLFKCTKLSKKYRVCFIDDKMHEQMKNPKLTYIHIRPYYMKYEMNDMFSTFTSSQIGKDLINKYYKGSIIEFNNKLNEIYSKQFSSYNFNPRINNLNYEEHESSKKIGKKLLVYLQNFFRRNNNNTLKKKRKSKRKTKRIK